MRSLRRFREGPQDGSGRFLGSSQEAPGRPPGVTREGKAEGRGATAASTLPVPVSFGKFDTFYQGLNMDRMEERGWWSELAMQLRAQRYRGDSTVKARRRRRIVRNRQGLGQVAEASAEVDLEESFNNASTSSGRDPQRATLRRRLSARRTCYHQRARPRRFSLGTILLLQSMQCSASLHTLAGSVGLGQSWIMPRPNYSLGC